MNEEEQRIRNQIAENIRAELVCCDIYDKLEPLRQEIARQQPGWSQALSEMDDAMLGHEMCYWSEASARIAEEPTK